MKKLVISITCLVFLWSCQETPIDLDNPTEVYQSEAQTYAEHIESLGFMEEHVVEHDDHFVIDDDIVMYKKDLDVALATPLKQARTTYLVSQNTAKNIRVMVDNSLSGWNGIIYNALKAWNEVESGLRFTIVKSNPHITIYSDEDADCPASHQNLGYYVCARATFPTSTGAPGATISVNVNSVYMNTTAKRLKVITHEFGHCIGFRHTNWSSRGESWAAKLAYTPSTDSKSLMNGGECGQVKSLAVFDRVGLCQMYPNGKVSGGTTYDMDKYRLLYGFCLADGKSPTDVVGMAIAGANDYCYVWYNDYTVSAGFTTCLDRYRTRYTYSLAPGKTPADIIGMGIAGSNSYCYAWYKDGTVSGGTSSDLDKYRSPYSYSLAPGKTPADVVAMAIAGSNDYCYAWYKDGKVSGGTSNDLDRYRKLYSTSLPPGKSMSKIVGAGIASNDYCYYWFKK
ncbi:MAG: M57 family metalloprotease [Bacteroidales bacterium]|nr:M57 family metalloprotease [Bacteroidales bacterium]